MVPRQPFGIDQRELAGRAGYLQTGMQDLARDVRGIHVELDGRVGPGAAPAANRLQAVATRPKITGRLWSYMVEIEAWFSPTPLRQPRLPDNAFVAAPHLFRRTHQG